MIKQPLEGGGFVLHKVHLAVGTGRYSAWYDSAGVMRDAEKITKTGLSRSVIRGSAAWGQLQAKGKAWAPKQAQEQA